MNVCTIIARNYVAHARVLAASFAEIHPEGTCSVLVIDDPSGFINPAEESFELLTIDQIGLPDVEAMTAGYDVMELSTAVKPWLLRHLLDRPGVESVMYLDPDIKIFAPLDEIVARAERHGVVLTPHFTSPLPRDGLKPSEEDILIAGSYNLGFIGLGASETADALLAWWSERLEKHCLNEPSLGQFVDQRWIDLAPGLWPGIDVLRDTSFNIAYWNYPTRELSDDGEGRYLVDGNTLRFFHFSGFDPRHPTTLSKHQTRVDVSADPTLTRICAEYAADLLDAGFEQANGWPYGWNLLPNGVKLDRAARKVFRDGLERGDLSEPIWTEAGAERLLAYMREPEDGLRTNRELNRYAQALWDTRQDFRDSFADIEHAGGLAFVGWLHATAPDTGVVAELLPGAEANGGAPLRKPPTTRPGVNVVGYLGSERGVGEAARQVLTALDDGDVATAEIDAPTEPERIATGFTDLAPEDHPYDFNLICVNADMLPLIAKGLGTGFFEGRNTAGLWFWEISHFPEQWRASFDYVDEVWVASEHVARALRPQASVPVQTIRMPIVPAPPEAASRAELGLPEGFCFFFMFDYRSVFRRKNPLGIVAAFSAAFEPGEGPSLVIKSICGDQFPAEREQLAAAVAERPEIHLLEDNVSVAAKNAMVASCDCYVSLHRSEGLGLTMGEAMYFGRPVIATGYSGNLDFMTEENSYLVPYELTEIGPDANPYPPDKEWADPDLERAAALMREVFEHPEEAAVRGRRAAEDIRRTHSPEAASHSVRERIEDGRRERLMAQLEPPGAARATIGAPSGRNLLEHLIHFSEPPARRGAGSAQAAAKRAYMRLLRPYAAHQQRINAATAESLDELREAVREGLRLEAMTERELDKRISRADELVDAVAAPPEAVDERLAPRAHPLLGETFGFRAEARERDGGAAEDSGERERRRAYLDLLAGQEPVFEGERSELQQAAEGSLGAVLLTGVAEHLELGELRSLLELVRSRLRPGGTLIVEAVNPHSPAALKDFWLDPTRLRPLFPETLLALCAEAGFASGDAFAPVGTGEWNRDRTKAGEYAVLASTPGGG
jgi:glycosyltransferase involved in cell wall biosynthesis